MEEQEIEAELAEHEMIEQHQRRRVRYEGDAADDTVFQKFDHLCGTEQLFELMQRDPFPFSVLQSLSVEPARRRVFRRTSGGEP